MTKQEVIKFQEDGHAIMRRLISRLSAKDMVHKKVGGQWTVRDILAHLAAWKWECKEEIDRVLMDKATWQNLFEIAGGENDFNARVVAASRNRLVGEVIRDWENAHREFIKRIKRLSEEEYNHRSRQDNWHDGRPLTVASLFEYQYNNLEHEAGHTREIREAFGLVE
jgi:hypothetical protein